MVTEAVYFVNNAFVPAGKAVVPVTDLAVQRGYGIFDFLKTIGNRIIFPKEHLDRFYYSAAQMQLNIPFSASELMQLLEELVRKNNMGDSGIKITLTGGASEDGYSIQTPSLIITQQKLVMPGPDVFEKGIRLVTYQHQRQLPHVKTIDYLMAIRLQPWIKEKSAADVLYHNNGVISECPRANFFIVTRNKELQTPSRNMLQGITRAKLLEQAKKHLKVVEKDITVEDATKAAEAFITSTTKGVLPVIAIDGKELHEGRPGEVTRMLCTQMLSLLQ